MDFDKALNLYAESVRVNYEFNELKNVLKKAKAANEAIKAKLANGIRVYAHRDNIDGFTAATNRDISYTKKWKANATLILDEEE